MKVILKILIFAIVITNLSCDKFAMDKGYAISIHNKSGRDIYVHADYILPDTLLPIKRPELVKVLKNQKYPSGGV